MKLLFRVAGLVFILWFLFFCLPKDLFQAPKSLVIYDREGELLFANIAKDEQWRFPKIDSVNYKIEQCVTYYEDEYFFHHPGINPVSIWKSFLLNLKRNDIKRGGSTITMQTIRLLLKNPPRTYFQKTMEIIMALRFELTYSKKTILEYYVSNAPYGGNIVGIEVAAWRYYNKSVYALSWAETAMLAVLPNQPSYIYPGKNQKLLLKKRNRLLEKMMRKGVIDAIDYSLAIEEPLPQNRFSIPSYAYHLSNQIDKAERNGRVNTTIDLSIQKSVMDILNTYQNTYKHNLVNNLAALVIDANSSEILAYVGNTSDSVEGNKVNMINRPRSSGSTLKPFLYAGMLDDGCLNSNTLIQDIPIDIRGYEPKNSSYKFDGLVPAEEALQRSLNIPWILSLKKYGYDKFYGQLRKYGFRQFYKSADHYGLSLVVGGGEITLQELADGFLQLSNNLKGKEKNQISNFLLNQQKFSDENLNLSKGAIWLTLEALTNVTRPENEQNWEYRQSQKIAWKTGTSHGFRDAWAVGVNSNYLIAVWVGNAAGNGRTNLTGVKKAAPIMFDILNTLPNKKNGWYAEPISDLKSVQVCKESGYTPNQYCDNNVQIQIPRTAILRENCPYHLNVFLDASRQYQVNKSCYAEDSIVEMSWFKLPLVEESYYKYINPFYKTLPPFHPNCSIREETVMEIIFPKRNSKIIRNSSAISNKIIFQATHRNSHAKIHWFIDNKFYGTTRSEHKLGLLLKDGKHELTVQDQFGNFKSLTFYIE